MNQKDLKGLEVKEMMKCEACGGFHPMEDSEVVVIKIIKGKNCELPTFGRIPEPKIIHIHGPGANGGELLDVRSGMNTVDADAPVMTETPVQQKPRKNIIPPGLLSMMIDPGHPGFDQFGAKETRRV